MKFTLATFMISLVGAVMVAPPLPIQARDEQAARGLFGGGGGKDGNYVSSIFDGAACVVSSVIGDGNPKCHGKGSAIMPPPPYGGSGIGGGNSGYNYTYDTNKDGSLHVTIQLEKGGSCKVQAAVSEAAKKCVAEKQ